MVTSTMLKVASANLCGCLGLQGPYRLPPGADEPARNASPLAWSGRTPTSASPRRFLKIVHRGCDLGRGHPFGRSVRDPAERGGGQAAMGGDASQIVMRESRNGGARKAGPYNSVLRWLNDGDFESVDAKMHLGANATMTVSCSQSRILKRLSSVEPNVTKSACAWSTLSIGV